jgi:hypothetical protein
MQQTFRSITQISSKTQVRSASISQGLFAHYSTHHSQHVHNPTHLDYPHKHAQNLRQITKSDLLWPIDKYAAIRKSLLPLKRRLKKSRQIHIGPYATMTFENYDFVWWQIHEMLHAERGGEEQIADELRAYNPLLPQGNDLVATFMLEIPDPQKRTAELRRLGHIEDHIYLYFKDHQIKSTVTHEELDEERTTADGKTSAVHFRKFPFTQQQKEDFLSLDPLKKVAITIIHPNYSHITTLPHEVVEELKKDLRVH